MTEFLFEIPLVNRLEKDKYCVNQASFFGHPLIDQQKPAVWVATLINGYVFMSFKTHEI